MTTRTPLVAALCAALLGAGAWAQSPAPLKLPLDNLGLEHLDIVVPDTAAAAKFYARIFRTQLHQQPVRDTLRYFVVLGDVPRGSPGRVHRDWRSRGPAAGDRALLRARQDVLA